jgi:hypothetical protein
MLDEGNDLGCRFGFAGDRRGDGVLDLENQSVVVERDCSSENPGPAGRMANRLRGIKACLGRIL